MPYSSSEGKLFFKDWLKCFQPKKILDVGAGVGTYAQLIKEVTAEYVNFKPNVSAVEVYEPYIGRFNLNSKYDNVYSGNITDEELLKNLGEYNLIIMGDVVEHISEDDML